MTDIVVETPRGRIHMYRDDGMSALVYVRPYGTTVVKPMSPEHLVIGEKIVSLLR